MHDVKWTRLCGTLALSLGLEQVCHGAFVSLQVTNITNNNDGLSEYAIYAVFDAPTDELLSIFDANISTTTGFFHNTLAGKGASAMPFTTAELAVSDNPDADSFVTIGLDTGDGNNLMLDPLFDENEFISGSTLGTNAGWFVFPDNDQGVAGPRRQVLIAVFTPTNDVAGHAGIVSGTLTLTYDDSPGPGLPVFVDASFITPAPGAVGLLALAGLGGRRRRRPRGHFQSAGSVHAGDV